MSGYPWQTGDELLANDLNAAIANSIGLSSGTLPLNGSLPMTGPITLAGNATLALHAVPLQQLTTAVAAAPFLPLSGGNVTGATDFGATIQGTTFETYNHRIQTGGTLNTALGIYGDLSGIKTGGNPYFAGITLLNDTMDAGGAGISALRILHNSGGAAHTGNRIGLALQFNFTGGPTNKARGMGSQYGGQWTYATASGNVGGTAGPGNPYGTLWGSISSATLASGATFWNACIGQEVDFGVSTGASAPYAQGIKIVLAHHNQAVNPTDFMLGLAKYALTDVGLGNGIAFGSPDGYWPIDASGTLIGTLTSLLPTPPALAATNGIDFSAVTFSGAAFRSSGFAVSPSGIITASVVATGSTAPRTLANRAADVVNVKDFGALGDGTTNDTAAIQAAANAVTATGDVLLFPAGVYVVTTAIAVKSNTTVVGQGATLLAAPTGFSVNSAIIANQNNTATTLTDHDIAVRDITLDYGTSGATGNAHAIDLQFVRNVSITNCIIQCRGAGNATALKGCYNSTISGCSAFGFINCGYDHWWTPSKARVINCYAETATAAQMVLFNPEPSTGTVTGYVASEFILADCQFYATGANAIAVQVEPLTAGNTVRDVVIKGNTFVNCAIYARGGVNGITVADNVLDTPLGGQSAISCYTNHGDAPVDVSITGNTVLNPATVVGNVAVISIGTSSAVISGNMVIGATVSGIDTSTFAPVVMANYISNGLINTPNAVAQFTAVTIGSPTGPTWTTGSAAPAATAPVGSLYSRVGGAVGATFYVSRGGGTWAAIAGV